MDNNNNTETKRCYRCGRALPVSAFGPNIARRDGLNDECRECRRQRYMEAHGGLQHAMRRFSDDELLDELHRRFTAYEVLESLRRDDVVSYLRLLGYAVSPADSHTYPEEGDDDAQL